MKTWKILRTTYLTVSRLLRNYWVCLHISTNFHLLILIMLGPFPLPRLDVVIVHRSFSGLGLASPHLLFLSPRQSLILNFHHQLLQLSVYFLEIRANTSRYLMRLVMPGLVSLLGPKIGQKLGFRRGLLLFQKNLFMIKF